MNRDTVVSADCVRRTEMPQSVLALSTLARIDYYDAFLADVGPVRGRTAEQFAREILEGAPLALRTRLLSGWSAIGLRIGPSDGSVLGWKIRRATTDLVLLGADSRIGMPGELLFMRHQCGVLFATFVHKSNFVARAVWATVEPAHVRTVRHLLTEASERLRR